MSSRSKIDYSESIAKLEYALDIMAVRIESLRSSAKKINEEPTLISCQNFYNDFQETYDLYFFTYLGHFLRTEHCFKEKHIRPRELEKYLFFNDKKEIVQRDYFWNHCASWLSIL
jgi:hypothetical protein